MRKILDFIKLLTSKDLLMRFEALRMISKRLVPEYRFKWPQMEWWNDKEFSSYLYRFNEENGLNADRRWMMYQLMRLIESVDGDTAECGVYQGAGSYIICKMNDMNETVARSHHLFDSFEGLSTPSEFDGNYWKKSDLCCSCSAVADNLSSIKSRIHFHKGWIPVCFPEVHDTRFALVHIDVDLYEPTRDSIEFFYPRLNEGGLIICDDYGFTNCPGATRAINEFLSDKEEKMLMLPDGGGVFIKGLKTSDRKTLSR